MRTLRALVVDDSSFNRRTISDLLSALPGVEVIGKAADGEEALRIVLAESPDLVTLDLEMPRMDGFTFLRMLASRKPTPVIVVSGRAAKPDVFRALELGALDFIVKPTTLASPELNSIKAELAAKVNLVRQLRAPRVEARPFTTTGLTLRVSGGGDERRMPPDPIPRKMFVIGASTGGPPALVQVFSRLPSDLPAAFAIAQHMPERFTTTFAERLERLGGLRVGEVEGSEPVRAGRAAVCPGGRAVDVVQKGSGAWLRSVFPNGEDRYVPSVDRLFRTAAAVFGPRTVGVILTGMGDDGTKGAEAIKKAGGHVIVESEETAAIPGMPSSAVRAGYADEIIPLHAIADRIIRIARS